jgi:CRISPR-associated endonuclease/helicase Cas3
MPCFPVLFFFLLKEVARKQMAVAVDKMIPPWGKWKDGESSSYLPLVDHCIDVASVFQALVRLPLWRERLGQDLTEEQIERLGILAFLHDFGKCNRGFQAKADPNARETAGHVLEAFVLLEEMSDQWPPDWQELLADLCEWFESEEQAYQMLLASVSHHGRPVSFNDYHNSGADRSAKKWWLAAGGYDPLAALNDLARAARATFCKAFRSGVPPIDATPIFQQRFAGLVMLADWIGSDTQFFPFRQDSEKDRFTFARKAAERALRDIGLVPPEPRSARPFSDIFPFVPTPLQAALAGQIELTEATRLLLAESDTGSGKTEAALAWFFRLYAEGKVDGLYFALPTRVAARELYHRVLRAVEAAFEADTCPRPVLLAAPGYVKVDGIDVPLLTDPQGTLWDDNAHDLKRERLWSSERSKRFLAAPVAVGTIDQALLSVLKVKHSLLRSVCLDRHLLVVDEAHASDPYMCEALQALLRGHVGRGGWALLLSATLGEAAAAQYFGREPLPLSEAEAKSYPLLSARDRAWPMPAAHERSIEVELTSTLTDDEALLPRLVEALSAGARVLVVCNTVARAIALFRRVEDALASEHPQLLDAIFAVGDVRSPHHGRFCREDREVMDAAVTRQLGKGTRDGARLVIGTQTLEQSLDIDADWLITDLAPMDVLIQRFGRLHRHIRQSRPKGFETPRALVRLPDKDLANYLNKDGLLRGPAGLGSVYPDGRVLVLTLQLLTKYPRLRLPAEARALIEGTTHPEAFATLPAPWPKHGYSIEGKELGEVRQALCSMLDERPFGDLHYANDGARIMTRLGRPTFDIPLAEPARSPFGQWITRLSVPAHWLDGATIPGEVTTEPIPEGGFRALIGSHRFRYTRFGLEKDDA